MWEAYTRWAQSAEIPMALLLGIFIVVGKLFALAFEKLRLPSIVGMLIGGVLLGAFGLVGSEDLSRFSFLSNLALALVALSLGLEFRLSMLRSLGPGISVLIIAESLLTFALVGLGSWLVSGSLPFGLAAGAVGAASAPTAPLAIASEFKAKGPLTNTIFAVTGFDDAIGIVIFSFAGTFAVSLYAHKAQAFGENPLQGLRGEMFWAPLREIGLALLIAVVLGCLYRLLTRKTNDRNILFLWLIGMMFAAEGFSYLFDYSLILCNMVMGCVIINQIHSSQAAKIMNALSSIMPIIFVLFFVFAGAQIDIFLLPSIGLAGLVYILCRIGGKWLGACGGAAIARLEPKIRKYTWAGLLSQVGIGLGLAMVFIEKLRPLGPSALAMGQKLLLIVSATSIIFEIITPILTRWALLRTGEIQLPAKNTTPAKANNKPHKTKK